VHADEDLTGSALGPARAHSCGSQRPTVRCLAADSPEPLHPVPGAPAGSL